ncbi:VWA domain-containing protein [Aliiglaciecola sp.]|nr:VWA domain-containing protein [Aliiglaciecola sp.]
MNANSDVINKTSIASKLRFNMVYLAVASVISLSACTSSNQRELEEQVAAKEAKEQAQQLEMVQVTGSRLNKQQERQKQHAMKLRQQAMSQSLMADSSAVILNRSIPPAPPQQPISSENYEQTPENGVFITANQPVSTFSIDVDTASYSNTRRMLNQGVLPPADAIRVEEFVNYFDYQYPQATDSEHPFVIDSQISRSPWNKERLLMKIGIKAPEPEKGDQAVDKNLVFLLDVSGSMNSQNKLPLVKRALMMLTKQLTSSDSVAIVVYAGASGVVLEPTAGNDRFNIEQALEKLSAGGSTNGGQGIELAYKLAKKSFKQNGINRVILATDGDFNVGTVDHEQLIDLIEKKRNEGVELTTLGFGQGNYNDHLMEQLANKGNGNYAYIDSIHEARKVLVDQLDATLQSVAKDVKIQVEFNPAQVAEYRLIGYENRVLNQEDFNNDKVDAGEVGAGHSVTAFYEVVLTNGDRFNDELRYQSTPSQSSNGKDQELAYVKLRYKPIGSANSVLISQAVNSQQIKAFSQQNSDFQFASSVIVFAQLLKKSAYTENMSFQSVLDLANQNKGLDDYGYRAEFVNLVRTTINLQPEVLDGAELTSR